MVSAAREPHLSKSSIRPQIPCIKKPPTYPPMQLMAALPESDPLAHVLA